MKKQVAMAVALAFGMVFSPIAAVTMAAETTEMTDPGSETLQDGEENAGAESTESSEEGTGDRTDTESQNESEESSEDTEEYTENTENAAGVEEGTENQEGTESEEEDSETADPENHEDADVFSLQIPQKLEVIIDPWEMDGKGQIYSEDYRIQNSGAKTGTLRLCCAVEKEEKRNTLRVMDKKDKLHKGDDKAIYIEMLFGDGKRILLNEAGSEYETELETNEFISFRFTGEVNENASENWEDGDIRVMIVYNWKTEGKKGDTEASETETESETEREESKEEAAETSETESETETVKEKETENNTETESSIETETTGDMESEEEAETVKETETDPGKETESNTEKEPETGTEAEETRTAEAGDME